MTRHLQITYQGIELFDGDIEELVFTDNNGGVKVEGRLKSAPAGGGLLDILTAVTKPKREDSAHE